MQTGVKAVDQLIVKHGIMSCPGYDTFQRRMRLTGEISEPILCLFVCIRKYLMLAVALFYGASLLSAVEQRQVSQLPF